MSEITSPGTNTAALTADVQIEPLKVRISMAVKLNGISRSRLYELIKSGELQTVKVGRSTLVLYPGLKKLAGLEPSLSRVPFLCRAIA